MTTKAELKVENEKTREVKQREENVKEGVKDAVHDAKQAGKDLAHKTENLDIKDAPDRLLPSVEQIDRKLEKIQDKLEEARHAQVGEKDLTKYPAIQGAFKDTQRVLQSNRDLLQDKVGDDDTLKDTLQHAASLASIVQDQAGISVDKLWSNWAALLAVVAGAGAGSWKQILQESGNILGQLKHTQDFINVLTDLQGAFSHIGSRALSKAPVDEKFNAVNEEWKKNRDKLLEDLKKVWAVLNESPVWQQLVAKGKALGHTAGKVLQDTKEQIEESGEEIKDSAEVSKLKEDFKNVLQLIVGKDGPSVTPFLDYCSAAYGDIIGNQDFSRLASEMNELFVSIEQAPSGGSQAEYEKQYDAMHDHTKKLLDNTVNNVNLRLALRESKKLIKHAKKDPKTKKLLEDSGRLIARLGDKKGVDIMNPQLLNEIRAIVVPILVDHFDNTPLPDYHGRDSNALGNYRFHLSEIRLGATGLVPSKVKVEFRYKLKADPSKLKVQRQRMLMYVEASDIQVAFKDVKWHYDRLNIPKVSDSGTVDLATAGKGIMFRFKAELNDYEAPTNPGSLTELLSEPKEHKMFTILNTECLIDDFHVRITDAGGANVFYEMLAGIWGTKIKHQIEHLVEEKMQLLANKFDRQLYDIVKRATQPSLAEETKDALLSAGKAAGTQIAETAKDVKDSIQSM